MSAASADAAQTWADPALVKALARAFREQRLLEEGRNGSISKMAAAEKIERGYLGSLLRLTLQDPVCAIATDRGPAKRVGNLPHMRRPQDLPGEAPGYHSNR
jgi:hypothetical protein